MTRTLSAVFARRIVFAVASMMVLTASLFQGSLAPIVANAANSATVTGTVPTSGPIKGGTEVTLLGSGFTTGDGVTSNIRSVKIGIKTVTTVHVDSDSQLRFTTPDYSISQQGQGPGSYAVGVVDGSGGTSTSPQNFTYYPVVDSVTPNSGPIAGGTTVTIAGEGFQFNNGSVHGPDSVCFGNPPFSTSGCNSATVVSANDTSITATSPRHNPGTVDVWVVVNGQQSPMDPSKDGFNYTTGVQTNSDPTVTGVSPNCCSKANSVAVTGTNFSGVDKVVFAPNCAFGSGHLASYSTPTADAPPGTHLTVIAPPLAQGLYDIMVHQPGSTNHGGWSACSSNDQYTYNTPTVTGIDVHTGPTAGGTRVNVDGNVGTEDFKPDDIAIDFGGTPACNSITTNGSNPDKCHLVTVNNHAQAQITSPPHKSGTVNVHASNFAGHDDQSDGNFNLFNYTAPKPVVTAVRPHRGPQGGGTSVTVTGTGFSYANWVYIGSDPTLNRAYCEAGHGTQACTVSGDTSITFTTPASATSGLMDVHVFTAAGPSDATAGTDPTTGSKFTYIPTPVVQSVTPSSGPGRGGNVVILHGSGFHPDSSCGVSEVKFGSASVATAGSPCTDTDMSVTVPAQAGGDPDAVPVYVTAPGGTSTDTTPKYTYTHLGAVAGVVGSQDGHLYVTTGTGSYNDLGGVLVGAPAIVDIPQGNNSNEHMYLGVGTDHEIYVRNDHAGWQRLTANTPVHCRDNPGALVDGTTLYIACKGQDDALWRAQTTTPTGQDLPALQAADWQRTGGILSAGPAIAKAAGTVTYFVVGTDNVVYTQTQAQSGDTFTSNTIHCVGHVAVATVNGTTHFACQDLSTGGLVYSSETDAGFSAPVNLGGHLLDGVGISANTGGVRFFVEGTDNQLYEQLLGQPNTWQGDGGLISHGAAAAPF